ncbi:MAG: T9SS type A sorting domain-containing protein [Ignavibacteriaceae bacterium]|nr:T9SS type A sorting domain-containing protein [Ignavibacteriaceae bacterium]
MKKKITYLLAVVCIVLVSGISFAQNAPIDFESGGFGANWTWAVFENGTNPPLEIIPNPDPSGNNTSETVAKFTALQTGNPWAGTECMHGDIGTFTLSSSNSIVKIMVWKPVVSDVGIKFVRPDGSALPEIKVANTLTNQWEELTFDFTGRIGDPNTIDQDQIVIFPDFDLGGRTQDNICYFDNITFSAGTPVGEPTVPAPTPTLPANEVISIFSNAYTPLPGVNLNPNWGQATVVSFVVIQGDTVMKYGGLNFQGTELNQNLNLVSAGMQYIHIDFWTANSTELNFFLISPGPNQESVALVPPGATEEWVSVDIPLSSFEPTVNLTEVFQLMFTGNGTIYLDNIYFSTMLSDVREVENSFPSDFVLEQNYPNPFNPATNIRFSIPEANQVSLRVYDLLGQEVATLVNQFMNAGTFEVSFDASNLPTGIYTYSITAGDFQSVKKMMLIK